MAIRVGINGFGRIGRCVFRLAESDPDIEIVAVNGRGDADVLAQLAKYDSVHGRFPGVGFEGDDLTVNGRVVKLFRSATPAEIPWHEVGVDMVIDSTGTFKDGASCKGHLDNGAKKVVITAPGKDVDGTIVIGVNDETYDKDTMHIVSNASCTTNCLAPVAKVLDEQFGIECGFMNTIHAYTGDQYTLDKRHKKDLRRARAAGVSEIPTTSGAAKAVGLVLPQLAGKLDGMATRVPVPDGSMVDLVCNLKTAVTAEQINEAMKAAAEGPMKGILEYTEDPIVSIDVVGNLSSSVFDSQLTRVMGGTGTFVKVIAWYDNEMGYSARVIDLAKLVMA